MKNRSTANTKKTGFRQDNKQHPLVSSLSEETQIAMGFRNPRVVTPDFSHKEDREKLKALRCQFKNKERNGGIPRPKKSLPLHNLILHVALSESNAKTTHCFKATENEIGYIKNTLLGRETVTKGFFAGHEIAV